jgi:hypothetical protein
MLLRVLPSVGYPPRVLFGLGAAAGLGLGLLLASSFGGFARWWAIGAAVLTVIELVLLVAVRRTSRH